MKIFIDTANVDEIKAANDLGVICGVTTNPSLIAKEGRIFEEVVQEITTIVDGPISAEVISLEADKMVEEALELAKIHKNIVIKIPMTAEGLKAVSRLSKKGIHTNVTLIFSPSQALLAARAGALRCAHLRGLRLQHPLGFLCLRRLSRCQCREYQILMQCHRLTCFRRTKYH